MIKAVFKTNPDFAIYDEALVSCLTRLRENCWQELGVSSASDPVSQIEAAPQIFYDLTYFGLSSYLVIQLPEALSREQAIRIIRHTAPEIKGLQIFGENYRKYLQGRDFADFGAVVELKIKNT